jgi:hypothetical protein
MSRDWWFRPCRHFYSPLNSLGKREHASFEWSDFSYCSIFFFFTCDALTSQQSRVAQEIVVKLARKIIPVAKEAHVLPIPRMASKNRSVLLVYRLNLCYGN